MTWRCYELRFKAKSGIHVGYRKLGMINQTRYYILGKTMWGAVTAILSRNIMEKYNPEDYKKMGEFVKEHLIFSYFYPTLNDQPMYPNYDNKKGLVFGEDKTKEEFEKEFVSSYVSTAVDPSSRTAEDGSLHEFEYIKHETEFVGHLFANDGNGIRFENNSILINALDDNVKLTQNISLFDTIKQIQVGGERNYGFGWLELVPDIDKKEKQDKVKVDIYNSKVKVNLKENLTLETTGDGTELTALAHVNIENLNFESIRGDIEPFLGREWENGKNKKGAGQKISDPKICLTPGTKFQLKENIKIEINAHGTWKLKT